MTPLHPAVTLTALTDVDVELPVNRPSWDLDLELVGQVGFVEGAAAVGADVGQRCLVDLVDLFGGRWLAVGLGAVARDRLAPRLLGARLGLALGEGPGLALAGTERASS